VPAPDRAGAATVAETALAEEPVAAAAAGAASVATARPAVSAPLAIAAAPRLAMRLPSAADKARTIPRITAPRMVLIYYL
jgi:hypothetical protein